MEIIRPTKWEEMALVAFFLGLLAYFSSFSCSGPDSVRTSKLKSPSRGITVTDDLGREVSIDGPPRRIIALAPNAAEIVFALGAGNRVVGVTDYCNYPTETAKIRKVGSFSTLNMELILSLEPDLVISTSQEQARFVKNLEDLKIPIYVCFPGDFRGLFRTIRAIGKLIGCDDRAAALTDSLQSEIKALRAEVDSSFGESNRLRVYLEIASHPLMTVGEHSFVGNLISAAGGDNIGRDIPRDYAVINPEVVISREPEVIFIFRSSTTRENIVRRLGWERIRAVRSGMIFNDLDEDKIFRPGPRSVQGAREIFERLLKAKEKYGESSGKR